MSKAPHRSPFATINQLSRTLCAIAAIDRYRATAKELSLPANIGTATFFVREIDGIPDRTRSCTTAVDTDRLHRLIDDARWQLDTSGGEIARQLKCAQSSTQTSIRDSAECLKIHFHFVAHQHWERLAAPLLREGNDGINAFELFDSANALYEIAKRIDTIDSTRLRCRLLDFEDDHTTIAGYKFHPVGGSSAKSCTTQIDIETLNGSIQEVAQFITQSGIRAAAEVNRALDTFGHESPAIRGLVETVSSVLDNHWNNFAGAIAGLEDPTFLRVLTPTDRYANRTPSGDLFLEHAGATLR